MAAMAQCRAFAALPERELSFGGFRKILGARKTKLLAVRAMHSANGIPEGDSDQILKCISKNAEVSVLSIVAKHVVEEAQRRHGTAPTASAALGRALIGSLLIAGLKGEDETLHVTFMGRGPLGQMTIVTSQAKFVKGLVANPLCDLPLASNGKLDVATAVGQGALSVVRNNPAWKQPYSGSVPISSGEVAEDFAQYLAVSEQINTAIGVGVTFGVDGTVKAARGFLVQALPSCSEATLNQLEKNISSMPSLSDASTAMTARSITESLLERIGVDEFSEPVIPQYGPCGVSELKPRMFRAVSSLGATDVKELLKEYGCVEVKCEFCAETVQFFENDLEEILAAD